MVPSEQIAVALGAPRNRASRRRLIKGLGVLSLSLAGITIGQRREARAAPAVRVAAPRIERFTDCVATVSVLVTIADLAAGVQYEASGDVLEWDGPAGAPDRCGALTPQVIASAEVIASADLDLSTVLLEGTFKVTDLDLVKGKGPASDETASPDLVEHYASIWLREVATGLQFGPWLSPRRNAVAVDLLTWRPARAFPGSELMIPRGGAATAVPDARARLPPLACFS